MLKAIRFFNNKSRINCLLSLMLILGFVLNFSLKTNAQARADKFKTVKIAKASPVISNIVGWDYDYTAEKWCGYYNCLINVNRGNNKIPKRVTAEELSDAINIASLQIKQITHNGSKYYLLYVVKWNYWYDYPTIEVGRNDYKETEVYLLSEEDYSKLWTFEEDEINTINLKYVGIFSSSFDESYGCTKAQCVLQELNNDDFYRKGTDYYLYVKKENKTTIRLREPMTESLNSSYVDFSEEYFEINYSTYLKLKI